MEELTEMYGIFVPNSPDRHVFKELTEVKKFLDSPLGKKQGNNENVSNYYYFLFYCFRDSI